MQIFDNFLLILQMLFSNNQKNFKLTSNFFKNQINTTDLLVKINVLEAYSVEEFKCIIGMCGEHVKMNNECENPNIRRPLSANSSSVKVSDDLGIVRKKVVRFADALGLDLVEVKFIQNNKLSPHVPNISRHVEQNNSIERRILEEEIDDVFANDTNSWMAENFYNGISFNNYNTLNNHSFKINNCEYSLKWKQCFEQPAIKPDFFKNLNEKKVSLETIHLKSHLICGVVRVLNICFNKNVKIRYTTDKWKTFEDVNAAYINNSCDGHTDRFSFNLNLENNLVKFFNNSQNFYNKYNIEFAIVYETSTATTSENECYWDNNYGSNYIIECLNNSSSTQIKNINEILLDLSNNLSAAFV
jgi:hypothetical protein